MLLPIICPSSHAAPIISLVTRLGRRAALWIYKSWFGLLMTLLTLCCTTLLGLSHLRIIPVEFGYSGCFMFIPAMALPSALHSVRADLTLDSILLALGTGPAIRRERRAVSLAVFNRLPSGCGA